MATSREETANISPERLEAAYTLLQLSRDDEVLSSTPLFPQVSEAPKKTYRKSRALEKQNVNIREESRKIKKQPVKNKKVSRKINEQPDEDTKDDSEETLISVQGWNQIEADPGEILGDAAERISEPIKKQLTMSDVLEDQCRLMLGKLHVRKKMLPLLKVSENPRGMDGLDVSVYGPDGEAQMMKFKMWSEGTPVLTSGWKEFVAKHGLKKHSDFLTVWMFRHRVTRKICFAIGYTRLPIEKPLSTRISNIVFPNPV
ncbi:unnamed protein product [Thlaspi arvense]|uniref:TF-B3 domain-containing protein n=1 Tax=Thlaspi arvense TaxID=13288 RepID=A0AAU9S994_THLAR|nr:unnamed protein product [Thlaspi arvense]